MDAPNFVEALSGARRSGHEVELEEIPGTQDDALALQLDVLHAMERQGEELGGWKIGLTSGGGRDLMGVGFRPHGYLLKSRILQSGASLPQRAIPGSQLEPELCMIMGKELKGTNLDPAECRAAVSQVVAAFEINEIRVDHTTKPRLFLADGLANWGIVVGSGQPPRDGLTDVKIDLQLNGDLLVSSPNDPAMDDPFLSLSRLCTLLARHGRGVEPGQRIIAGSFMKRNVTTPGAYTATFKGLGDVTLNVT